MVGIGTPRWTEKLKQSGPNSLKNNGFGKGAGVGLECFGLFKLAVISLRVIHQETVGLSWFLSYLSVMVSDSHMSLSRWFLFVTNISKLIGDSQTFSQESRCSMMQTHLLRTSLENINDISILPPLRAMSGTCWWNSISASTFEKRFELAVILFYWLKSKTSQHRKKTRK